MVMKFAKNWVQFDASGPLSRARERLCRAPHRFDPPRMFGSHHHLERSAVRQTYSAKAMMAIFSSMIWHASVARMMA
jgi:hypothetical protein